MRKIGICFPRIDYNNMTFEEFKKYLIKFKEAGVNSFDFYTTMFLKNSDKLKELMMFLKEHDIKITFHYNFSKVFKVKGNADYNDLLELYKSDLLLVHNTLKIYDVNYKIPVVFHALGYTDKSTKYNHQQQLIKVFKKLSEYANELNFEITIETLSNNHPRGNHIGDDIDELELFVNNISDDNFGICWDIGHTRLNNIENNTDLTLTPNIINRVKFTHIHNVHLNSLTNEYQDHLPLTDISYQYDELRHLIKNEYNGIYSLEIDTKNLRENILVYINSVKSLGKILNEIEEEYNGFRKDS